MAKSGGHKKGKGRGIFLTIMLVLHALMAIIAVLFLVSFIITDGPKNYDITAISLGLSIIGLLAFSAAALWKWSVSGVYALAVLFFLWLIEFYFYELPSMINYATENKVSLLALVIQGLATYLAISFLYAWSIKRKFYLFS